MYLRSWFLLHLVSGVFALNEHITVCPSSISVQLPSATTVYTIAITLTNSGTETAYLTLLANDTFNNERESSWRASQAYAPLLIPRADSTSRQANTLLSDAALQFHNTAIDGHGVMLSHGNVEQHPHLDLITSTPPPSSISKLPTVKQHERYRGRISSRGALVDWHTVVVTRPTGGEIEHCTFATRRFGKHARLLCPTIAAQTLQCQARAFWLDDGTHIELRFPTTCTAEALNNAITIWTNLLGGGEVEADEVLTVEGEQQQNLRGGDVSGGGVVRVAAAAAPAAAAGASPVAVAAAEQSFNPAWPNEWQYQSLEYAFPLLMINATKQWPLLAQYPIASSPTVMTIDIYAQLDHEDLANNYAVNLAELNGVAGVDDDGDGVIDNIYGLDGVNMEYGDPDWSAATSHGTSVAGLIGAMPGNDLGATGISPQARVLPCGTGNSTISMLATIECMNWALENAKRFNMRVINHSYTGAAYSDYQASTFMKMQDIGMIHTVATGNSNLDMDNVEPPTPILYLATDGLYSLIGVARLDKTGAPAPSGYSAEWTNFYMPGELTLIVPPDGSSVALGSGTSFAAPTTAGVIASMLTVRPELDIFDVLWILENSIVKLDSVDGLCKWGGFVNASLAIQHAAGTWIKPKEEASRHVTLSPGESKTVNFTVTLQPEGFEAETSRTAYLSVLGLNSTRLSGVYKMGEVPITVSLAPTA